MGVGVGKGVGLPGLTAVEVEDVVMMDHEKAAEAVAVEAEEGARCTPRHTRAKTVSGSGWAQAGWAQQAQAGRSAFGGGGGGGGGPSLNTPSSAETWGGGGGDVEQRSLQQQSAAATTETSDNLHARQTSSWSRTQPPSSLPLIRADSCFELGRNGVIG